MHLAIQKLTVMLGEQSAARRPDFGSTVSRRGENKAACRSGPIILWD
jgi:hypothetical protein